MVDGQNLFYFLLWIIYIYRPQTKFAKVMFLHLSVSHSVHRGGLLPGGPWSQGGCLVQGGPGPGGVPGPKGGYLVPVGVWSRGSAPGGCLVRGVCLVETPQDGYCCGRYASYWNAFLLTNIFYGGCVDFSPWLEILIAFYLFSLAPFSILRTISVCFIVIRRLQLGIICRLHSIPPFPTSISNHRFSQSLFTLTRKFRREKGRNAWQKGPSTSIKENTKIIMNTKVTSIGSTKWVASYFCHQIKYKT